MELIYSKTVDKSVLWDGFSIKTCYLHILTEITGKLEIGEKRPLKFLLHGKIYNGIKLLNSNFNHDTYPNHKDIYQVRYSPGSDFSKTMRSIFSDVWDYVDTEMKRRKFEAADGKRDSSRIRLPETLNRKIALFTTNIPDVWMVETYGADDNLALSHSIEKTDELDYELSDSGATIVETEKKVRLRILDHRVGDNLKKLYGYRCQVCGESVGIPYGSERIADSHHIDPFTTSLNNDFKNIMVLCPNHHRIIHTCHGDFHRNRKEIWYPNGLRERLRLNLHL